LWVALELQTRVGTGAVLMSDSSSSDGEDDIPLGDFLKRDKAKPAQEASESEQSESDSDDSDDDVVLQDWGRQGNGKRKSSSTNGSSAAKKKTCEDGQSEARTSCEEKEDRDR